MMLLDIPFQVNEADLRECLKARLDVIADIVVEVDEPTWLEWQHRRKGRVREKVKSEPSLDNQERALLKRRLSDPTEELYHQDQETSVSAFSDSETKNIQENEFIEDDENLGENENFVDENNVEMQQYATDTSQELSNVFESNPSDTNNANVRPNFPHYQLHVQRKRRRPSATITTKSLPLESISNQNFQSFEGRVPQLALGQHDNDIAGTMPETDFNSPLYHQAQFSNRSLRQPNSDPIHIKHEVISLSDDEDEELNDYSAAVQPPQFTPGQFVQPRFHPPVQRPRQRQIRQPIPISGPIPSTSALQGQANQSGDDILDLPTVGLKTPPIDVSRPHVCQVCGRCFHRKTGLRNHLSMHLGIKRFQCDICSRLFSQTSALYRHKRDCHSIPVEFTKGTRHSDNQSNLLDVTIASVLQL